VSLEVVTQLPRCNEDLAGLVHRVLDPLGGGSDASTSMSSGPGDSWPPGSKTIFGSWDPTTS
jgi:hypothetical protein